MRASCLDEGGADNPWDIINAGGGVTVRMTDYVKGRAHGEKMVPILFKNAITRKALPASSSAVDDEVPELEDTNDEALVCAIDILNRDAKLLGKLKTFMKSNPLDLAATDPTHIAKQITSQCSIQFA